MSEARRLWTKDEFILALNLYLKLPFGKLHSGTPEIIHLAHLLGRTPSSIAMRLNNFASVNTYHQQRGIGGLPGPVIAFDDEDALDKILIERRKQLLMRDLRWMDIKRLNKEGANISLRRTVNGITYSLQPNDNKFALPLPETIIRISGMTQNPR